MVAKITLALLIAMGPVAEAANTASPGAGQKTVLVLGDSLSAAHGMVAGEGWVSLLAERLAASKPAWRVVNASISGETSAGGASRIERELERHRPAVVVVALGANDGLRGLPVAQLRGQLEKMVRASKAKGARVLLVGMQMPPNLGKAYTEAFARTFSEVAEAEKVPLLPFLLEPIARDRAAFQPDNLHPTVAAQPRLRDHVWPALQPLLEAPRAP